MPTTIESQEAAVKLFHNWNRLNDSLKEYVHLMELLGTAQIRLENIRNNNGDVTAWESWISEHNTKVADKQRAAGEAFDELRKVLGCGPECKCEPIKPVKSVKKSKPAKKSAKKSVRRTTYKRG